MVDLNSRCTSYLSNAYVEDSGPALNQREYVPKWCLRGS